jgi:hypothetical protein
MDGRSRRRAVEGDCRRGWRGLIVERRRRNVDETDLRDRRRLGEVASVGGDSAPKRRDKIGDKRGYDPATAVVVGRAAIESRAAVVAEVPAGCERERVLSEIRRARSSVPALERSRAGEWRRMYTSGICSQCRCGAQREVVRHRMRRAAPAADRGRRIETSASSCETTAGQATSARQTPWGPRCQGPW